MFEKVRSLRQLCVDRHSWRDKQSHDSQSAWEGEDTIGLMSRRGSLGLPFTPLIAEIYTECLVALCAAPLLEWRIWSGLHFEVMFDPHLNLLYAQ